MYFINPNCFRYWIHSMVPLLPETFPDSWVSWKKKKKFQEKFYHCEKHLPPAIVSPSTLTTPPASRHKKRRETPFSLLWVKRQISLMRAGCDYALRKEQKKKKKGQKKEKRGGGKSWQKPHIAQVPPPWSWLCTDLLVLVVGEVVQP